MLNKPKRIKRTTLKNKADKLFRDLVRARGVCQLAGLDHVSCGGVIQTMHIIGRANYRLRWDLMNAICGCSGHHRYYTSHPFEWFELIKQHFPENYEYIHSVRNEFWNKDYEEVMEKLKNEH